MNDKIRIENMPTGLREALGNRGHDMDAEMTPKEALSEWSAWHLGDEYWAKTVIHYYDALLAELAKGEQP